MRTTAEKPPAAAGRHTTPFFNEGNTEHIFGLSPEPNTFFQKSSSPLIQPKLAIGQPNDKYEREADAVADKVVRQPENHIAGQTYSIKTNESQTVSVKSKCEACEQEEEIQEKEQVINAIAQSQAVTENENNEEEQRKEDESVHVGPGTMPMVSSQVIFSTAFPVFSQTVVPQIQLRANIGLAPADLSCIAFDTLGTPGTLDVFFDQNGIVLDATDKTDIENFVGTWVAGGLSDDLLVSGYASTEGPQTKNWRLSCGRAEAVETELLSIGVPPSKITTFAHGETEDFSTTVLEPNRRATVTTTPGTGPIITPVITPTDNFAGRSLNRFGLSEDMSVNYNAVPGIGAAEHFGVQWTLVTGSGTLISLPSFFSPPFPAFYRAGNIPAAEQLALTVVSGPAAGVNLITANLQVVTPLFSNMVQVPGTGLCHTNGTASAGFRGNVFMHPRDISFNNVQWREGNGTGIGVGSLRALNGIVHATSAFMTIGNGNLATGCQVNTVDSVSTSTSSPNFSFLGFTDWSGSFIWPIQWQYQAPGGAIVTYMTAFHICTINSAGTASQSKAGAGPFSRALGDPTSCVVGGLPAPHCC